MSSINFLRNHLVSITDLKQKKKKDFSSRFSAKERTYMYKIINRQGSLSINKNKAWHVKNKLDQKLLKKFKDILTMDLLLEHQHVQPDRQ